MDFQNVCKLIFNLYYYSVSVQIFTEQIRNKKQKHKKTRTNQKKKKKKEKNPESNESIFNVKPPCSYTGNISFGSLMVFF